MRPDASRVADIRDCARAIADRFRAHTLDTLLASPDAVKATFYDVIIIGEAMRELVVRRDPSGKPVGENAPIVQAHPEIPWADWIGFRDMVTHQYFRAAPEIVWRDYEDGALQELLDCCQAWLNQE